MGLRAESGDRVGGDDRRHSIGRMGTIGTEPLRGPVERAQERARRNLGIAGAQRACLDAGRDQGAHAPFVAIAFGDDQGAPLRRQGVDLEVGGRAFDFVNERQHVRFGESAE